MTAGGPKIERQPKYVVSNPPSGGPHAWPALFAIAHALSASGRSCGS